MSGQTIRVTLPIPLVEDATALIDVSYRARLRTTTGGRDFLWSRVGGIAHIYRFIPWISRRAPYGPSQHGEPFITGISPLVRVDVDSDRALVWATSGHKTMGSGRKATYVARNVRDFNIAASPSYRTKSGRSRDGRVKVVVHTRTISAARLLRLARTELARIPGDHRRALPVPDLSGRRIGRRARDGVAGDGLDPRLPQPGRPGVPRLARDRASVVLRDRRQRPAHRLVRGRGARRVLLAQGARLPARQPLRAAIVSTSRSTGIARAATTRPSTSRARCSSTRSGATSGIGDSSAPSVATRRTTGSGWAATAACSTCCATRWATGS